MTDSRDGASAAAEIRRIDGLLQRRQIDEARTLCDALLMREPDRVETLRVEADRDVHDQSDLPGRASQLTVQLVLNPDVKLRGAFVDIVVRVEVRELAERRAFASDVGGDSAPARSRFEDSFQGRRLELEDAVVIDHPVGVQRERLLAKVRDAGVARALDVLDAQVEDIAESARRWVVGRRFIWQ